MIVIPAFNEQASVAAVVRELHAFVPDVDVVVVDDGSTDRTGHEARRAGARVLTLPFNLGVGGAMRAGYRFAVRNDYDAVVQVDADGQHEPQSVALLLAGLTEADLVIGARFAGIGDYKVKGARLLTMRLLAFVISRVVGTRLTDTTSGFRACNRRTAALFAHYYPAEYLGDTIEALLMVAQNGLVVSQVPVTMRPRAAGAPSQNAARSALYLGRAVMALLLATARRWPEVDVTELAEVRA